MATGATIVVIDDDESILHLMRSVLHHRGFKAVTASSGEAALGVIDAELPDLVLLDLGLQDVPGRELIPLIREKNQQIPIVIVSGQPMSDSDISALGAADFLQKPFEIDDLVGSIRRHLAMVGC